MEKIIISGFADEISPELDKQLQVVRELGMDHISLRSADGKGIAEYTAEEFAEKLLPRLDEAQVKISSMGSPIGKIQIDSEEDFENEVKRIADTYKMEVEKVRSIIPVAEVKKDLAVNKAIDFIKSKAEITAKKAEEKSE